MSLRKSSGEDWEKPPKPESLIGDIKKAHILIQCGTCGWRCVCGKSYEGTRTRRDAEIRQGMHQAAVKECLEDRSKGISRYGDDD